MVTPASSSVSRIGGQMVSALTIRWGSLRAIAVSAENLAGSLRPEEIEESRGSRIVPPGLEQHCLLPDRSVEVFGYQPAGPARAQSDLREGKEPHLRIAGADELVRLRDVRSDDLPVSQDGFEPERPHDLQRRPAVGGKRRICERDTAEIGIPEGAGPLDPFRFRC